jgi:excisionase family DNA binding protein
MKRQRLPRLMSADDLAEYLGLQKQTIYNWLNQKKISGIKIGKVWRFDRKYIDQWLQSLSKGKNEQ